MLACIATVGCQNIKWRGQDADGETGQSSSKPHDESPKYVNDTVAVWGTSFAKVEGIALVTQLDHTGSDPKPSGQREQLVKEMQTNGVQNPAEILASDTTSMVIVAANLPPGIRKGERFDVFVTTFPNSETTSLRGGFVMKTTLRPKAVINEKFVKDGHIAASVEGRIQVKSIFEGGTDPMSATTGYILGGGIATRDMPLGLAIRDEFATIRTAMEISRAINARFTTYDQTGKIGVAKPKNDHSIELFVPEEYRQNLGRYIRVVVNIAYQESAELKLNRMEQLERELNEPALAQQAALRLEAIGREAVPALKRALRNEDAEVRFYAAEALAYLDQREGLEELKTAAIAEPDFRWHALTALASSEELVAGNALSDLFHVDNAETRYGAFRAMLARSPHDPLVVGTPMPGDFYLHVIPSTGSTMVHFSTQNRAEIVVFGGSVPVSPDFIYVENGLTVRALQDDSVELTRYLVGKGEAKLKCKNTVADVIGMMAQSGCSYESMLSMCKDAQRSKTLNCRVMVNRVPKLERLYNRGEGLSESAEDDESTTSSDAPDSMPSMFVEAPDAGAPETGLAYPEQAETDPPKKGVFATMKSWFTGR
jgi:hypothetical protein